MYDPVHIIVFMGMPIMIYEGSQMAVTMVKDLFAKNRPVILVFNILGDYAGGRCAHAGSSDLYNLQIFNK